MPPIRSSARAKRWRSALAAGLCLTLCVGACTPGAPTSAPTLAPCLVHVHADGRDLELGAQGETVRATLRTVGVEPGPLDEVEPPLWTPLACGLRVRLTRVREERVPHPLPYAERLVRDEFLAPSVERVLEPGRQGLEEWVYRVRADGEQVLSRELVARARVREPQAQVRLRGAAGTLPAVPISGTLTYLANGQAWAMRGSSARKRPLSGGPTPDGRVWACSPDGNTLLYSAPAAEGLNHLWTVETQVLNATPQDTGLRNVLWAEWAPGGRGWAYATGHVVATAPGWQAHNDLALAAWPDLLTTAVLTPTNQLLYSWWGESWAWAPSGRELAWSQADRIGVVALAAPARYTLRAFTPFHTPGAWAWTPALAISPDGRHLAAVLHVGNPVESRFDLQLLAWPSGELERTVVGDVGPWARAAWSPAGDRLAWGTLTAHETYQLYWADILAAGEPVSLGERARVAVVELAWGPGGQQLSYAHQGDLYLYDLATATHRPLTASGLASHPCWRDG